MSENQCRLHYCLRPGYSSEWIISSCKRPILIFFLIRFIGFCQDSNRRHFTTVLFLTQVSAGCTRARMMTHWVLSRDTQETLWTRHPVQSTVTSHTHCISPTTFLINQSQSLADHSSSMSSGFILSHTSTVCVRGTAGLRFYWVAYT